MTFIVVGMEGCPKRACQMVVEVRVRRKACGGIHGEDFTLRKYSPLRLVMRREILVWRPLVA
jgi:hypothetical protein